MNTYDNIGFNFSHNNKCLDRVVGKIKTPFLAPKSFVRKPCRLCDEVGKCGRDEQARDVNITPHTSSACCTNNATDLHSI